MAWPQQPSPMAACCLPARDVEMWAGHSSCTSRPVMRWADPLSVCCAVRSRGMLRSSARSYALSYARAAAQSSSGGRKCRPPCCFLACCMPSGGTPTLSARPYCSCSQGVVPSDQMHDMLISMCTQEQRLEEAVDLVKRLARRQPSPGSASAALAAAAAAGAAAGSALGAPIPSAAAEAAGAAAAAVGGGSPPSSPRAGGGSGASSASASGLQEHTLNSLIRALCGKYPDRALRLLSLCQVRMRPSCWASTAASASAPAGPVPASCVSLGPL